MSNLKGNKEAKDNKNKPRLSLIPKSALYALGDAMTYGEKKYDAHNWRKGIPLSYLLDAALRHIQQFNDGENYDEESKAHHLGSAMANLAMAIEMHLTNPDADDRYNKKQDITVLTEEHLAEIARKTLPQDD